MKTTLIPIDKIIIDHNLQIRASIHSDTVNDYAEAYRDKSNLPPLDVFKKGDGYILADGFHRIAAAKQAGLKQVSALVHLGDHASVLTLALAANSRHGVRMSNEDKRRAVGMALKQWPKYSDRAIAKLCFVGYDLVAQIRVQLAEPPVEKKSSVASEPLTKTQLPEPAVNVSNTENKSNLRTGLDGKNRSLPQPKKEPEIEVALDSNGYPIPLALLDNWNRASAIATEQMRSCSAMQEILNLADQEKDNAFNEINISHVKAQVSALRFQWKMVQPLSVCPYCFGKLPDTCKACGASEKNESKKAGKGWLGKFHWDSVPPEIKKKMQSDAPRMIAQVRKEMERQEAP